MRCGYTNYHVFFYWWLKLCVIYRFKSYNDIKYIPNNLLNLSMIWIPYYLEDLQELVVQLSIHFRTVVKTNHSYIFTFSLISLRFSFLGNNYRILVRYPQTWEFEKLIRNHCKVIYFIRTQIIKFFKNYLP